MRPAAASAERSTVIGPWDAAWTLPQARRCGLSRKALRDGMAAFGLLAGP